MKKIRVEKREACLHKDSVSLSDYGIGSFFRHVRVSWLMTRATLKLAGCWSFSFVLHLQLNKSHSIAQTLEHWFPTHFSLLFHMVPFFFLSMVAQKTSKLRYSDWLLRNFNQSESGYLSYHGEQNGGHHAKEHWKLSWKLVSKISLHFVGSHRSEKQTVSCPLMHSHIMHLMRYPTSVEKCKFDGVDA